jgi:hypothetical protein
MMMTTMMTMMVYLEEEVNIGVSDVMWYMKFKVYS